jgi:hypothetical protein
MNEFNAHLFKGIWRGKSVHYIRENMTVFTSTMFIPMFCCYAEGSKNVFNHLSD